MSVYIWLDCGILMTKEIMDLRLRSSNNKVCQGYYLIVHVWDFTPSLPVKYYCQLQVRYWTI